MKVNGLHQIGFDWQKEPGRCNRRVAPILISTAGPRSRLGCFPFVATRNLDQTASPTPPRARPHPCQPGQPQAPPHANSFDSNDNGFVRPISHPARMAPAMHKSAQSRPIAHNRRKPPAPNPQPRRPKRAQPHPLLFPENLVTIIYRRPLPKADSKMKRKITLKINGKPFTAEVEPRMLLIHYLREVAGFTGPHIGCETSICGACTVALDGKIVKSCTMFAVQADGREVVTIEGLASNGDLHPMQEAFWNQHGLQCGFCTPGMIMASRQLLERNPHPTDEEIRHSLDGNLCRCTGYQHIVNAVKEAADKAGA